MPNDMPGAARYVRTNMAVPTAGVGINPKIGRAHV